MSVDPPEASRPDHLSSEGTQGSLSDSACEELQRAELALREQAQQLEERVKELNCLYRISRTFDRREAQLPEILREVVQIIPAAWQCNEVAGARIQLAEQEFRSNRYVDGPWLQQCPVIAFGRRVGELAVSYSESRPERDEGPFLLEERNLLNTIAQSLGEIVERKWTEQRLEKYRNRLRSLAAEVALSEQRERRRLAEALHDRIGQTLAMVNIRLGAAVESAHDEETARSLREIRALVGELVADTRTLTFELCPPILYEMGLEAALGWLVDQAAEQYGIRVELQEQGQALTLPEEIQVTLFQSVRELLNNIAKHARAQAALVEIRWSTDGVQVAVQDDGVGFDPALARRRGMVNGGFGLFSIQERLDHLGGEVVIQSERGQGSRVILKAPPGDRTPPEGEES
ncbi:MAG: sensor histidine kinase [Bradymonadales bacterium]|nr:sensor histidine kinase [Bradymonadales bacterium]